MQQDKKKDSRKLLMQYAGMGAEFVVAIGLGLFFGLKIDKMLHFSVPLFVWLLPLLIIIGLIFKIIIETNKK